MDEIGTIPMYSYILSKYIIPLTAVAISLITFMFMRRKANEGRVDSMEYRLLRRIEALEDEVKSCIAERDSLERKNIILLERLFNRNNTGEGRSI